MNERQEPSLNPRAGDDGLIAPPRRAPAAEPPPRRRRSPAWWLLWWPLILIGLVLLPVVALRWLPPPTTAFMLQSPKKPVSYQWVSRDRIADTARRAVVAAEDQKFWEHQGFDLEAIEKAVEHNRRSKRKRGASTISQQTVKNLFLWSGGGYFRKGIEAGYTVLIETLWSKDRILEVYLNIAEFGPGVYGVEAAAQRYFRKPASMLTPAEAARLAAVLPSPRRWSAASPGPYVQKRSAWILGQMGYGPRRAPQDEPEEPEEPAADTPSDFDMAPTASPETSEGTAPEPTPAEAVEPTGDAPASDTSAPDQAPAAPTPPEPDDVPDSEPDEVSEPTLPPAP